MKDQLPPPDFNSQKYERPNQKWVCGWLCEGKPCSSGPDGKGRCGAVADCKPVIEPAKEGEKPRYICTRSKELGGPCEEGPRADGSCSHPPKKCQPRLSLRARRGLFTKAIVALTVAALLVILYGAWRWYFISPGEISVQHNSEAFRQMVRQMGDDQRCAACHSAAQAGPVTWLQASFHANPAPHEFRKLLLDVKPQGTKIDANCQQCHRMHNLHEPNVPWDYSCSACHEEHLGAKRLKQVDAAHCLTCHADAHVMQTAAKKGASMEAGLFSFQHDLSRISFKAPRPTNGYTQVIHEFAKDHPEFQVHRGEFKDANTLRFSHVTHAASNPNMPSLKGEKLDCASCHKPSADGVYYGKITFENNCKACHALQFDAAAPDLQIPHGDPSFVHAFLRSLPQQYADYATRSKKIFAKDEVENFVRQRLGEMRRQYGVGEELEEKVFFSTEKSAPVTDAGRIGDVGRPIFPGCAYCHEIKRGAEVPVVTAPVMMERWMSQGRFNHAKHGGVACLTCHGQAVASTEPADIMLPSKAICANCHNPSGGARNDCTECHSFHHRPNAPIPQVTTKAMAQAAGEQ